MMYFNTIAKTFSTRLALLAAVLLGAANAVADNVVSIADFEIAAGQQKEIAILVKTDAGELTQVQGDLILPAGLTIVTEAQKVKSSTGSINDGATIAMTKAGHFNVRYLPYVPFSGNNGTVIKFWVEADESLAQSSTISFSVSTAVRLDGQQVTATTGTTKVTRTTGGGDDPNPQPGPDDPTEATYKASFASSLYDVKAGETADIEIQLTNNFDLYTFEGVLEAGNGISIVSVTPSNRVKGTFKYNENSQKVMIYNPSSAAITGQKGGLLIVTVQADADFEGTSSLALTSLKAAGSNAQNINGADASVSLNVFKEAVVPSEIVFSLSETSVILAPGRSVDVDVVLTNNVPVKTFEATLILPEGITATAANSGRSTGTVSLTTSNKLLLFDTNGVAKGDGAIITLTLTADDSFTEDGELTLSNVHYSLSGTDEKAKNLTLTIKAKDEATYQAALDIIEALRQQLADKIAEIEEEYPDAADDEDLLDDEAAIDRAIDILAQGIEDGYEANDLDLDEIEAAAEEISADIEALEAKAQEIQEAIDAQKAAEEANKAGYANLLDEIAELIEKLEEAEAQIPGDLPKSVDEAFDDESFDILMDIDDLRDAADDAFVNGELTADSHLDPAAKKAILDDIAALLAKIKTWLRGDVAQNQVVEMPDFYALADSILNENLPTDKEGNAFYRFDANADDEINVGDMQGIVNIVLGMDAYGYAARQAEAIEASLSVETMKIGNITRYTLNLTGMEYTAFQMDVNGRVAAESAEGMTLRTADLKSGSHRVLGFGNAKTDGTVLCIDVEGQAQFSNIVFTTASAQTVKFSLGTTGIASVKAAAENGQAYDLNGRAVKNAKGVVIVDGKKVIR